VGILPGRGVIGDGEMIDGAGRNARLTHGKHRERRLAVSVMVVAGLIAGPALAARATTASPVAGRGAAGASCPWVTSTAPISQRVSQLMA
jgi:beta-glucosidase